MSTISVADDTSIPLKEGNTLTDVESRTYVFSSEDDSKKEYSLESALELAGHGCYNYLLLFTCSLIMNATAIDTFGFAAVVAASSCDLDLDLDRLGILAASPFAGVLFAFPWGYFMDTQGRRRALLLSTSVSFIFAVVSSFSTHWLFMLSMKVIGCSFSTASFTLTVTMLGEGIGQKHRSQYLFIMNSFNLIAEFCTFALAWLILPLEINIPLTLLGITIKSWRLFTIVLAVPLGVGACLMLCLYESPKYLASRGNYVRALEVLKSIYERNGGNGDEYPVKQLIQSPSEEDNIRTKQSFWSSLKRQTLPIFQPPLLWRTIQLFFSMTVCCVTNNVFVMWYPTILNYFFKSFKEVSSSDQTFCERVFRNDNITSVSETYKCDEGLSMYTIYTGMIYGLVFGGCSLAVVKIATRPKLLLILIIFTSAVSFLCVNVKQPIANMIFFTLLQSTSLGIGCISSYFVELYPAMHRGLVSSLCMMVARLSALVGISVIGNIVTKHCEATFYTWSVFLFGVILVCLFLPNDKKARKS